jgi:hypothetical protein
MGNLMENVGEAVLGFPPFTAAVEASNWVLDAAAEITGSASYEYKQLAESIEQEAMPAIIDLNKEFSTMAANAPKAFVALEALPKFGSDENIKGLAETFKTVTALADQASVNIQNSVLAINEAVNKSGPLKEKTDKVETADGAQAKSDISQVDWRLNAIEAREKESAENRLKIKKWLAEQSWKLDEEERQNLEKLAQAEKLKRENQMQAARGMTENFRTAAEEMKEFGILYQVSATSTNIMDTYASATASYRAMASIPVVGPTLGFAAAGAAIAAGLANEKKILSAKFEDGGIVPGYSYTGDNVPARVNSGEMILNSAQQANLFNMANGKGGGGVNIHFNLPPDTRIDDIAADRLAKKIDSLARDGYFDNAYNLKSTLAA